MRSTQFFDTYSRAEFIMNKCVIEVASVRDTKHIASYEPY